MRLSISKSKNATSLYVMKSTYENGVHSTKIVEKLGTEADLREKLDGRDPYEWAKEYIEELNRLEKAGRQPDVIAKYRPSRQIEKGEQRSFQGGYLFLQDLYHKLGLPQICKDIALKHSFHFDLNAILSSLLYGRILFPSSKLSTWQQSRSFIEPPAFDLHQVYRALGVIAQESETLQAQLYQNSLKLAQRNTGVLYYDCTNFFFEIEQEEGLKQYGLSKEHRPNPIVQMGLFMDGSGIPLAFHIQKGNTNEQITLKPLEMQILKDFQLSKFVVCTDAGLASTQNRKFNDTKSRSFVTTQSVKLLKDFLKQWALDPKGWKRQGHPDLYDLAQIDEASPDIQQALFYKERWIKENGLEQRLIVTYSLKYRDYQRQIRHAHIERAQKLLDTNPSKIGKPKHNDFKRYIDCIDVTEDGEVAEQKLFSISQDRIAADASYDGFYAVCTNLEDEAPAILAINSRRWKIEESFRILKSEFKARPVYLKRDDRILAHFVTCFIALLIFRLLEKKLGEAFTADEIITGLRQMNFHYIKGDGYVPTYTRTDFTDALHDAFGFRTDYEIVPLKQMKKILKQTKS